MEHQWMLIQLKPTWHSRNETGWGVLKFFWLVWPLVLVGALSGGITFYSIGLWMGIRSTCADFAKRAKELKEQDSQFKQLRTQKEQYLVNESNKLREKEKTLRHQFETLEIDTQALIEREKQLNSYKQEMDKKMQGTANECRDSRQRAKRLQEELKQLKSKINQQASTVV